ncbi:MAG: sulfate adenylyltransferase subunit CysN, partial [Phycisphaerae bacterium]|nr:sulfate adenylyltransferase subunit CysN [Phycisphaerae bacterium]
MIGPTDDVATFFDQDEKKDLLRFVTAGSVDDGKSTLIGRLLFESKGIYEDQLDAVRVASGRKGSTQGDLDLALVTDGLKAEREQGITIDVAYRYFSTPRRKFIIADSPGHEQYTRNMATGASTANLAIILIDAAAGVMPQSKRHAFISSLLGIPHVVVTVNKMDLVDYSQEVFDRIVDEFTEFSTKLEVKDMTFIPISALAGDNVVERSSRMLWYEGSTLLNHLESVHIASDRNLIDLRFPVQYVCRPDSDFRGFMGTPASGIVRRGDEIVALPSGVKSRVKQVLGPDGELNEGFAPVPITLTLEDEIDVSRGDMIVHVRNVPHVDRTFEAMVVWMAEEQLELGKRYTIKHATRQVPGVITDIRYRMDVNTLHRQDSNHLGLNEIGRCEIELARPVAFDPYRANRSTGAFIIVDRLTNNTVGAGMMLARESADLRGDPRTLVNESLSKHAERHVSHVSPEQRHERYGQKPATVCLTGLIGAGKSTIGYALEKRLFEAGRAGHVLDGRNTRLGLNIDLDFSAGGRSENLRRAAEVAKLFNRAGLISICAFVCPVAEDRELARQIVGADRYLEVYLSAPIEACRARSAGNLYERADAG